jgi:NAD+ synthetase
MEVRHNNVRLRVPDPVMALVKRYRATRRFDPGEYMAAKTDLINRYCREHGITELVIGVSGGVDSAVAYGLCETLRWVDTVEKITPVALPVSGGVVADQDEALRLARAVTDTFGGELVVMDLGAAVEHIIGAAPTPEQVDSKKMSWARGQIAATIRTPALYYMTSLATVAGRRAVVVGTTNNDEGAYLGYIGKASDATVDLQIISDLHKSEVIALGRHLGVPEEILDRMPTGDMFDGATDAQVFGAPYEAVELLAAIKRGVLSEHDIRCLSPDDQARVRTWFKNLEKLHSYNAHKYLVGSPAVHLDLYDPSMPGGWPDRRPTTIEPDQTLGEAAIERLHGWVPPSKMHGSLFLSTPSGRWARHGKRHDVEGHDVVVLREAVPESTARRLVHGIVETGIYAPAGPDGYPTDGHPASLRTTLLLPQIACSLFSNIRTLLPEWVLDDDDGALPSGAFRPAAVTDLARVVVYPAAGELWAHCDAPYLHDDWRTLYSLVVCLAAPDNGVAVTQFAAPPDICDPNERHRDWGRPFAEDEITLAVELWPGDAVLFPHRLPHASPVNTGRTDKIIARFDVIGVPVPVPKKER